MSTHDQTRRIAQCQDQSQRQPSPAGIALRPRHADPPAATSGRTSEQHYTEHHQDTPQHARHQAGHRVGVDVALGKARHVEAGDDHGDAERHQDDASHEVGGVEVARRGGVWGAHASQRSRLAATKASSFSSG